MKKLFCLAMLGLAVNAQYVKAADFISRDRQVPNTTQVQRAEIQISADHVRAFLQDQTKITNTDVVRLLQTIEPNTNISICIPNTVESIENHSFYAKLLKNYNLTNVNFEAGSKLRSIGTCAFRETAIQSIRIPENCKIIESSCFYHCYKLRNVTLSNNLEKIGSHAFFGAAIENIRIPATCQSIGESSFQACFFLKNLIFDIFSQLTRIGDFAFAHTSLSKVILPHRLLASFGLLARGEVTSKIGNFLFRIGDFTFKQCGYLEVYTHMYGGKIVYCGALNEEQIEDDSSDSSESSEEEILYSPLINNGYVHQPITTPKPILIEA